jgi:NADH-quinone oxidoreductase subunit I
MLLVPVDDSGKLTPQKVEPGVFTRSIPVMQDPTD